MPEPILLEAMPSKEDMEKLVNKLLEIRLKSSQSKIAEKINAINTLVDEIQSNIITDDIIQQFETNSNIFDDTKC